MRACHVCCHGERNERLHFTTKYRKALAMRYPTLDIGAENLHRRVNPIIPQRRDILRSTALLKKTFKGNKKKAPKKPQLLLLLLYCLNVIIKKTNKLSSFFDGDILCWWHFPRYTGLWNSISQCLFWVPVRTPLPPQRLVGFVYFYLVC